MAGDGAVVGASSTKDHYAFGESNAARRAFAGRTIDADLAFLVPFLKPGLSLVDCGCGGGGLAVQLSERLTPGEVVGFDQNGGAIEQAKQLARISQTHLGDLSNGADEQRRWWRLGELEMVWTGVGRVWRVL